MPSEALMIAFKIVLLSALVSLLQWVFVYSMLARWWRNPVGLTLVTKTILLILVLIPSVISSFFHLSPYAIEVLSWIDVGLLGLITPVMIWRTAVWLRIERTTADKDHENGGV